jgi:hypothetical protein
LSGQIYQPRGDKDYQVPFDVLIDIRHFLFQREDRQEIRSAGKEGFDFRLALSPSTIR